MTQQLINVGTTANDGAGDPLRTAFIKANNNFSQLFEAATGNVSVAGNITGGNLTLSGSMSAQGAIQASVNKAPLPRM